jgi:hypothetical protein
MTIDERIEGLTQSLELLSSLHRDLEEAIAKRAAETDERFARLAETMNNLGTVVLAEAGDPSGAIIPNARVNATSGEEKTLHKVLKKTLTGEMRRGIVDQVNLSPG